MAINVIKQTPLEAVVQVISANGTITLSSLLSTSQVVSGTPTVNIKKIYYNAASGANIVITRNALEVFNAAFSGCMDFTGFALNLSNTSDIACAVPANSNVILVLHKVAGYTDSVTNLGINPENVGPR